MFIKRRYPKYWEQIKLSCLYVGDKLDLPPLGSMATKIIYPSQMPFELSGFYHENRVAIGSHEVQFGPFSGLACFACDKNRFVIDCSSVFLVKCRVLIGYSSLLFWSGVNERFVEVGLSRFDDGSFFSNQVWASEQASLVATENRLIFFDQAGTILQERAKLPTERIDHVTAGEVVKINPEGDQIVEPIHFKVS